jgi:hypothetical protein
MKIMTVAQEKKLVKNGIEAGEKGDGSHLKPVIKLFGGGACTWLLSEYYPEEGNFFGLCDLGQGCAEIGYVSRVELEAIRFPPFGLPIERDMYITLDKTMAEYTETAKAAGRIVA